MYQSNLQSQIFRPGRYIYTTQQNKWWLDHAVAVGHAQNINTIQLFATGMDCEIACTVALILLVAGLEPILVHKECPSLTPNVIDFFVLFYM